MQNSAVVWVVASLAVLLVGVSKAGFAGGVGVIATPLLGTVMPLVEAAALLLPLLIVVDTMNVYQYRGEWDRPNLRLTLPAALVGIVAGSFFIRQFADRERVLQIAIGAIVLGFLLYQLTRRLFGGQLKAYRAPQPIGVTLGAMSGFTSTLAHVGGPLIAIYLLPQKMANSTYVATTTLFFFVVNTVKLLPYALLGLLTVGNLWVTLLLTPLAFFGVRVGFWLNRRFDPAVFQNVIYVLLLLTGVQLVSGRSLLSLVQ